MKLGFVTVALTWLGKHKHTILTATSVVGSAIAVAEAVKEAPKIRDDFEELEASGATTMEKFKRIAPKVAKIVIPFAAGAGATIYNHVTTSETIATLSESLAGAYVLSKMKDDKIEDLRAAVREVVGEEEAKKVEEEAVKREGRRAYEEINGYSDVVQETGFGDELFCLKIGDGDVTEWFRSSRTAVDRSFLTFSMSIINNSPMYHDKKYNAITADVGDLFDNLGLRKNSKTMCWVYDQEVLMQQHSGNIEPVYITDISPVDKTPYTLIVPSVEPIRLV